jgi:hypothetical protein
MFFGLEHRVSDEYQEFHLPPGDAGRISWLKRISRVLSLGSMAAATRNTGSQTNIGGFISHLETRAESALKRISKVFSLGPMIV